jgi:23S rRNA (guanine745-N1)-methyltransferase
VTMPLLETAAQLIDASSADSVLDVGCGNGDMLGTLAATANFEACGVDISVAAVDAAARRYPNCQWIVANADSFIPYQDGCFSILLSITARMNPAEFRRVLREDGRLLVAIPAPADLVELRGAGRDRVERTVQTFAPGFQLLEHRREKTEADLDRAAIEDVLHSIYRPAQPRSEVLRVTFSLDFLLFRPA